MWEWGWNLRDAGWDRLHGCGVQTIGLFGGTFDPVHLGHVLVAEAAFEELGLDRLVFVPAACSPFKPGAASAPAGERLKWLRLASAGRPGFAVDDWEVRRGGISYSIDTVREFGRRFPGARLFWLIGEDHVPTLPEWRDARELAEGVEFAVIPRPGAGREGRVGLGAPWRLTYLRGWPLGVSASEIRERIRAGREVRHVVPEAVAEAIRASGAYRERP